MPQFHMATLEPPDDAAWHLAADHYETSGDMDEDAQDWAGDVDLDDDQMATIRDWYRQSSKFSTAIDDRLAGEAWP